MDASVMAINQLNLEFHINDYIISNSPSSLLLLSPKKSQSSSYSIMFTSTATMLLQLSQEHKSQYFKARTSLGILSYTCALNNFKEGIR